MRVHCPTCLRVERWEDAVQTVVAEGGRRRPSVHPELAAWRTVLASRRGEIGPIVGRCQGCEQPLVGDAGASIPWRIVLPEGALHIGDALEGPNGPLPEDLASAQVEAAYAERTSPGRAAVQGALVASMLAPFLLWLLALWTTLWFLWNYGQGLLVP